MIVVLDETGLWLGLRGEEQVLLSFQEIYQAQRRKEIRKAIRLVQATEDLASKKQLEQKVQEYMDNECINEKSRDMVSQFYHSGGDKHRLNRRLKFICSKVLFSKLPSPSPSKMTCSVLILSCRRHNFAENNFAADDMYVADPDQHQYCQALVQARGPARSSEGFCRATGVL